MIQLQLQQDPTIDSSTGRQSSVLGKATVDGGGWHATTVPVRLSCSTTAVVQLLYRYQQLYQQYRYQYRQYPFYRSTGRNYYRYLGYSYSRTIDRSGQIYTAVGILVCNSSTTTTTIYSTSQGSLASKDPLASYEQYLQLDLARILPVVYYLRYQLVVYRI